MEFSVRAVLQHGLCYNVRNECGIKRYDMPENYKYTREL